MKKIFVFLGLFVLINHTKAQFGLSDYSNQWSYEFAAGTTNYNGDLIQKTGPFRRMSVSVGANLKYRIPTLSEVEKFEIRFGMYYGRISGDDKMNSDPELKARGLSFKSHIFEMNLGCEYSLLDMNSDEGALISPYAFAGIGFFNFNPYTFDNENNKVYLQPLCTEGQGLPDYPDRKKYKLTQFVIPIAIGVKVNIGNYIGALDGWLLSYELMYHHTFTDYLDDVSKRYPSLELLKNNYGELSKQLSMRDASVVDPRRREGDPRGNASKRDVYFYNTFKMSKALDWSQISIADWFR